ncbi:MAG: TRAP transporter small permease [Marinoscillum sp.]|uniref:TRAP transporter small permease n=2 Tax=Marinoscillum sp. TaxID=2024838 RepID=UPI00330321B1
MKNKIDKILEKILVLLMAIMVLNVLWQVASRFLLNSPSGFTDELAGFLLIWVGLIGSGYATGQGLHMAIDILPKSLEGARFLWVMRFIHFSVALFALLVMIIGGSNLVYVTLELEQLSSALQLPMGYVYLAVPLSGILMIYYSIYYLIFTESNGSN